MADKLIKDDQESSTQLDSHANMVVVGENATIIAPTGKTADVRPFSEDLSRMESVPIVDAAMAYDCPFSGETFILAMRNVLYVKSMQYNLIPPFLMEEAGLVVNTRPKIHTKRADLSNESHCIVSTEEENGWNLRIPMKLDGIFSYFPTRALTQEEIDNVEHMKSIFLTPDQSSWDPYDEEFAEAEDAFFDFRGELINRPPPKRRKILDDAGIFELKVSEEQYEAAISTIVAENDVYVTDSENEEDNSNPQGGDLDFLRDDDYMQAGIADLSACFDEELL